MCDGRLVKMDSEIEAVVEEVGPKDPPRKQIFEEPVLKDHPSFLHISGTVDSKGRAVVVVLGSRLPKENRRESVPMLINYIKQNMDWIVERDYVLLYCHSLKADSRGYPDIEFCKELYDNLPHEYKKNLKRVVLLHATDSLRAAMSVVFKSFLSPKVFKKVLYPKYVSQLQAYGIDATELELPVSVYDDDVRQMVQRGQISTNDQPTQLFTEDPIYKGIVKLHAFAKRGSKVTASN